MNRIIKTILAGFVGTAIMTLVTMIAPMMGMPKISPPAMLSGMMGMPIFIGWVIHFMVGILFAFAYSYLFMVKCHLSNVWLKGLVFGIIVFLFAQIMILIIGSMMPMHSMQGSMVAMIMGSLVGHIVFGISVAKVLGKSCHCSVDYCSAN